MGWASLNSTTLAEIKQHSGASVAVKLMEGAAGQWQWDRLPSDEAQAMGLWQQGRAGMRTLAAGTTLTVST